MLRRRNDAHLDATLRLRASRDGLPRLTPTSRHLDRRRHADEQDGSRPATSIRPDAGSEMGHQHGELREWGRVLSL